MRKDDIEVMWFIRLYQSNYTKSLFKNNFACIKDFESICDVPIHDKTFRNWINQMKEIGIIQFAERKNSGGFGRTTDYFYINKNNILKRIRKFSCYNNLVSFFDSRSVLGVDS